MRLLPVQAPHHQAMSCPVPLTLQRGPTRRSKRKEVEGTGGKAGDKDTSWRFRLVLQLRARVTCVNAVSQRDRCNQVLNSQVKVKVSLSSTGEGLVTFHS